MLFDISTQNNDTNSRHQIDSVPTSKVSKTIRASFRCRRRCLKHNVFELFMQLPFPEVFSINDFGFGCAVQIHTRSYTRLFPVQTSGCVCPAKGRMSVEFENFKFVPVTNASARKIP